MPNDDDRSSFSGLLAGLTPRRCDIHFPVEPGNFYLRATYRRSEFLHGPNGYQRHRHPLRVTRARADMHLINGRPIYCHREQGLRCRMCELLDPTHPDYSERYHQASLVPALPAESIPPQAPAAFAGQVDADVLRAIPLAGDLVEQLAHRLGADRLARLWERWTGKPCGCADRREWLNRVDRAARKLAGFAASRGDQTAVDWTR